jgi:hypothetical protein
VEGLGGFGGLGTSFGGITDALGLH